MQFSILSNIVTLFYEVETLKMIRHGRKKERRKMESLAAEDINQRYRKINEVILKRGRIAGQLRGADEGRESGISVFEMGRSR